MSETEAKPAQDTPQAGEAKTVLTEPLKADAAKEKSVESESSKAAPEAKAEPAKPVVPEKYDLKLPDGSRLSAEAIQKVALFAKEKGLSQEQAQLVLERESEAVTSFEKGQQEDFKAKTLEWIGNIKADKELGGEAFNQNAELAKRVVRRFGTEAFVKTLDDTGLGNHPELLRVFVRIGKLMSEDQLILPGARPQTPSDDIASVLYPTSKKREGA